MKQDLLWETWMQLAYQKLSPILTRSERGQINSALKELREIGATPEQLKQKFSAFKRKWPTLGDPTITALTKHWNSLETRQSSPRQTSYSLPDAKPTPEGYRAAIESMPAFMQRQLKAKHGG